MRETRRVEEVREIKKGGKYVIAKNKRLNEMTASNFTLQELRFLCIYLGMINPMDLKTRKLAFTLDSYQKIMEIGTNLLQVEASMNGLMDKKITIRSKNSYSGYDRINLFTRATLCRDEGSEGGWVVEMSASEEALELFFNQRKGEYFKYGMWNAVGLKSFNQVRLYEWLKQHEWAASKQGKIVMLADLRAHLEIGEDQYLQYSEFKKWVLEPCRKAINGKTDIMFDYEIAKTVGRGGKVSELLFRVRRNPAHVDQLKLQDFGALIGAAPNEFFDRKKFRRGAGLLTKFQGAAMQIRDGDIEDVHELMDAGDMDAEECGLFLCWEATGKEFGPEDLKVLRDAAAANWVGFGYKGDPNIEGAQARKAFLMARHMGFWYNIMKKAEADGSITHSPFAYLRALLRQPMPT